MSTPWNAGRTAAEDPRIARAGRTVMRQTAVRRLREGNRSALRHGVYAEVAIREDVLDEAAMLYARAVWLDEVRDGHLVESTARLIVRLRKLDAALDADPSQILTSLYARLEGQLTRNLDALGLTPRSAAALGLVHMDAKARAQKVVEGELAKYRPVAAGSNGS